VGAVVTIDAEKIRQMMENQKVLQEIADGIAEKASGFDDIDMKGLAFAAHMVAEAITIYSAAFRRAYLKEQRREEGEA
jgi:hypothetical protein